MKKSATPNNDGGILRQYYLLAKPGIVYGNALPAIAAFVYASGRGFDASLFAATIIGTCLIIASACVCNNYIDRGIDRRMHRTRLRALVTTRISGAHALIYGAVLGLAGFSLLTLFTNALTVLVGAVGFIGYVALYGYAKRRTHWATLIGTIPGATPPVAGYVAVTGQLDLTALLLFLTLAAWQMPHFYAIAIFRLQDYQAAGIPVLPAVRSMKRTMYEIIGYTVLFAVVALLLPLVGPAGLVYVAVILAVSAWWLMLVIKGLRAPDTTTWARGVFGRSLYVLLVFCAILTVSPWLP